jgi:hypothetical protein
MLELNKLLTVILLLLLHSHGATITANASNPTLHQAQGPTATLKRGSYGRSSLSVAQDDSLDGHV